ncbi:MULTISPECIES: rhodanese-like domain-containing protein [Paenisporosarcina]|uniref:Rhodanese-like domain-containing protein n=1 Tax=Paenisporosarcina antarctica TaxID=417367 RepID=A0A4P6ZXC8_9BACL|nr:MULTISPECIES: rhodanese-like domain-containing protein [Paenisporosarcina]QBP40923.1 rhodanese-like domain-containing protein [Paenisporosarcina antarctica]
MEYLYIIAAGLFGLVIYFLISSLRLKKAVSVLSQEQFIEGYRKAQLVDVREPKEFDGGHILGSRNIPSSQMRQRFKEIRPDKPVYLYCQNSARSARTALFLKKKGCTQIYQLKGGFRQWTGKIKTK